MIFRNLGVCHRTSLLARTHYRRRMHGPTLHRDRATLHDPGCGGGWYSVSYVGQDFGEVRSAWSLADGVHWQAIIGGMVVVEKGSSRPLAHATKAGAVNTLLAAKGWQPDYVPGKGKSPS